MLALFERIEADAEHAGDQLQLGILLVVFALARVRGYRFATSVGQFPVTAHLVHQRWRETLLLGRCLVIRCTGFTVDDQAENPVAAPEPLVGQDFFVRPARSRRTRRADDDLAG